MSTSKALAAILTVLPVALGASVVSAEKVYWCTGGSLNRANLDGTEVEELVVNPGCTRIALDAPRGKIYWTASGDDALRRANLDGSDVEDVVTGLSDLRGVAVDIEAGKLYWTVRYLPCSDRVIQRANLDGSNIEDLVTEGLVSHEAITLDTTAGKMYWINGIFNETVMRANLDGSDVEDLFPAGLNDLGYSDPSSIALDLLQGKIYMNSHGAIPFPHILRADLDGTDMEAVPVYSLQDPVSLALDAAGATLYWIERNSDTHACRLRRGSLVEQETEDLTYWIGWGYGVALDLPRDCNGNGRRWYIAHAQET